MFNPAPRSFDGSSRAKLKHHKPDIIHFLKSPQNLVANVASLGTEAEVKLTVATDQ